jgi:hypothetical protein
MKRGARSCKRHTSHLSSLPPALPPYPSLIHIPVNVPALAATTGMDVDLNKELKAHGASNLLCGLFGGLQTYMAYS